MNEGLGTYEPYDYLIVGSGLWGATFAFLAKQKGKRCFVIERRKHFGGNLYCEEQEGINIHKYGPHIFHTNNKEVWDFVNQFVVFNNFNLQVLAKNNDKLYHLPFNMNTFYDVLNVHTPKEAKTKIEKEYKLYQKYFSSEIKNIRDKAASEVGMSVYESLIKEYTQKQWGRKCEDLPSNIISRLPVRFTFNNNYFNDKYQGVPVGGYNKLIDGLLEGIDKISGVDFLLNKEKWSSMAKKIVYTGSIDEYYNYAYGVLEYRTCRWEEIAFNTDNEQGCAIINYINSNIPYTRVIEHKHFECLTDEDIIRSPKTILTYEYPQEWNKGLERLYPINDDKNKNIYAQYEKMCAKENNVIFGGRLAEYQYYDMDDIIESVLKIKHII